MTHGSRRNAQRAIQTLLIVLAAWFVYWPAVHGRWLWDDDVEVTGNLLLRDRADLGKIWFGTQGADYFPLKTTLQWVQWHLWGENVVGYHLTNIVLHVLSALLIWRILGKLLGGGRKFAWIGGLLFVVHPLAVESVAWISELKNVLSLALLLLAAIAWISWDDSNHRNFEQEGRGGRGGRRDSSEVERPVPGTLSTSHELRTESVLGTRSTGSGQTVRSTYSSSHGSNPPRPPRPPCLKKSGSYFLSLALFLLATLSKSSVVMFPFVLLLYAWWKRGRVGRRDLLAAAPFFLVSIVLGLVTIKFQAQRALAGETLSLGGPFARIDAAGLALAFYFWKAVVPVGLMPIYPRWAVDPAAVWQFWPWVVMVAGFMWLRRAAARDQRYRGLMFGLGFFVINLVPVLGFVPMSILRLARVADHLAYLPLVGLVGLATAGLDSILGLTPTSGRPSWRRQSLPGRSHSSALRPSSLAERELRRGSLHPLPRWRRLAKTPAVLLVAALLGLLAVEARNGAARFADAETLWSYTLRHNPEAWAAHNDLGNAFFDAGRVQDAVNEYEAALRLHPDYPEALNNLGNILSQEGRAAEAAGEYREALRLKPDYAQAHNGLGNLLSETGHEEEATQQFELALRLSPDYPDAHSNLGNMLFLNGRYPEAEAQLREALRIRPGYPEAHNNLGNVLTREGRLAEALAEYREALRLRPDFSQAVNNFGNAEMMAGRLPEAAAAFERAIQLRPEYAVAHYNLGLAFSRAGHAPEAIRELRRALELQPDFSQARAKLEQMERH